MKTSLRLALVILPFSVVGPLAAQTDTSDHPRRGPGPGGPGGPGRGSPVVRVIDADRNHELSNAELAAAATAILTLAANKEGAVSAAELHPARPADAPARPTGPADADARPRPTDPVMLALDANSDGNLSSAEIGSATTSLLTALDANKDGKLTGDELRPLPPEGAPAGAAKKGPRR